MEKLYDYFYSHNLNEKNVWLKVNLLVWNVYQGSCVCPTLCLTDKKWYININKYFKLSQPISSKDTNKLLKIVIY